MTALKPQPVKELILASASQARQTLLRQAGLSFRVIPADLDESLLKQQLLRAPLPQVALALASAKAEAISHQHPKAWVIGADQMLGIGRRRLDKPHSLNKLAEQLNQLRGRRHQLVSAVTLAHQGAIIWHHVGKASLTMRDISDEFIQQYCCEVGESARHCVGGYQLESLGVQLFSKINGDYFTILGLPLLPLFAKLRDCGLLAQ